MASPPRDTLLDLPLDPITAGTRKRVRAYFEPPGPDHPRQLLVVGVPALALLIAGTVAGMPRTLVAALSLLGVVVFGAGALLALVARRRATDAEVDLVRDSDFERAQRLARNRAQLVATDLRYPEACAFRNARVEREYGGAYRSVRFGEDERTRWTPIELTTVLFGHQQLFVHRCAIDLTTGDALYETTREIFYPDVVSVITHGERITRALPKKKRAKVIRYWSQRGAAIVNEQLQMDGVQVVSLRLANGEDLEIARWDGMRDGKQPEEAPRQAVTAARLRALLRATKERVAPVVRLPRIVRHPTQEP